jgi:hypothetical protein
MSLKSKAKAGSSCSFAVTSAFAFGVAVLRTLQQASVCIALRLLARQLPFPRVDHVHDLSHRHGYRSGCRRGAKLERGALS